MSKILSGIELEVIVSKLMAAKAEIVHLIIEEENVSEAASDLWGVIEMLQEIILKTSISAPNFVSNRPVTAFITTHLGAEVIERRRCCISSVQRFTLTRH